MADHRPTPISGDPPVPQQCAALHRALLDCHRRVPAGDRLSCRQLNQTLARCLVGACCPGESEAVRSLCSSAGTALKRRQCDRAKIDLAMCMSSHQQD